MMRCTWYHSLVAGTALISGVLLVAVGIYLRIDDPLGNIKLAFTDDTSINRFLAVDYIAMFVGFTLIIVAITGALVAKRWPGRPLAVAIYTVLLFGMMGALIFISIFTLTLANGRVLFGIESKLEQAWENTVKISPEDACAVQEDLNCSGFRDEACTGCETRNGTSGLCTAEKRAMCPYCGALVGRGRRQGCYGALMDRAKGTYRATGFVAAGVAGVLLVDSFVVCAL